MHIKKLLFIGILLMIGGLARGQGACTVLGQKPATAFPVCGSSVFTQSSVPACFNGSVPVPSACSTSGNLYEDLNPYWYKFTCFKAGTLQLTIQPKNLNDDYDWQIFDVTGHDPVEVYSNANLFVACNWSGRVGITGTNTSATSLYECGSSGTSNPPIFSQEPTLIEGHNYLLMISHFSGDSQSGYDLSFDGGTASITDTVTPAIKAVLPSCDGSRLTVVLNKKMKCAGLTSTGSDFIVKTTTATIVSATGNGCAAGFDMDTITLTMSSALTPGDYTVVSQDGSDGNTLLDNCGTPMAEGLQVAFHITAPTPIEPDSLVAPQCAPSVLTVVFPKAVQCSTVATDGSDFNITGGSSVVTVSGASAVCDQYGLTYTVQVQLSAPIVTAGTYTLHLRTGVDGNPVVDECGLPVQPGPGLSFTVGDTVSAQAMSENTLWGCVRDTIALAYPNIDGVNQWSWIFGNGDTSHLQNPYRTSTNLDTTRTIQLIVSNGFCTDTTQFTVVLNNAIKAALEVPEIICPEDAATYQNNSQGTLTSYLWDLGDGTTDTNLTPGAHHYPVTGAETKYDVRLIVGNALGCYDTAYGKIDVLRSCYIAVPSAFTPNGDGMNDYLYPLNAFKASNMLFKVYNRYGQLVFSTTSWTQKWDGTINGHPQPSGTYVWTLQYTDLESGKKMALKGTSILIR